MTITEQNLVKRLREEAQDLLLDPNSYAWTINLLYEAADALELQMSYNSKDFKRMVDDLILSNKKPTISNYDFIPPFC